MQEKKHQNVYLQTVDIYVIFTKQLLLFGEYHIHVNSLRDKHKQV